MDASRSGKLLSRHETETARAAWTPLWRDFPAERQLAARVSTATPMREMNGPPKDLVGIGGHKPLFRLRIGFNQGA